MIVVLFMLMSALLLSLLVTRLAWHTRPGVIDSSHTAPVSNRMEMTAVRITAVLALDHSLLIGVTANSQGITPARDETLVAELCGPGDDAAVDVLSDWYRAGTPVLMNAGADRLRFQARAG